MIIARFYVHLLDPTAPGGVPNVLRVSHAVESDEPYAAYDAEKVKAAVQSALDKIESKGISYFDQRLGTWYRVRPGSVIAIELPFLDARVFYPEALELNGR